MANLSIQEEQELQELIEKRIQLEAQYGAEKDKRLKSAKKIKDEHAKVEQRIIDLNKKQNAQSKEQLNFDKMITKQLIGKNKEIQKENNLAGKGNKFAKARLKSEQASLGNIKNLVAAGKMSVGQAQAEVDFLDSIKNGELDIGAMGKEQEAIAEKLATLDSEKDAAMIKHLKDKAKLIDLKIKEQKHTAATKDALGAANKLTGGLVSKAADFVKSFASNPLTAVAGVLTAMIGMFVGLLKQAAAKVDTIAESFGTATKETEGLMENLLDAEVSAIKMGKSMADVVGAAAKLNDEFGIGMIRASELASEVSGLAGTFGVSVDEATSLVGLLEGFSIDRKPFIAMAESMALANDVAPAAVLKTMTADADSFAKFMSDGAENMVKAAVQAKKLGINLSTSAKVAEGLLDFSNSITKEMEASVLIGRRLNFQKARELALNNDIEGAMKNVLLQLGGEEEFNRLNAIQRQAVADSIGVSVGELAKMAAQQDKMNLKTAMNQKTFDELINPKTLSGLTRLINGFKAMGAQILNALTPHIEAAADILEELFGDADSFVGPLADKVDEMGASFVEWLEGWKEGLGEDGVAGFAESIVGFFESLPGILEMATAAVMTLGGAFLMAKAGAIALGLAQATIAINAAGASGSVVPFGGPIAIAAIIAAIAGAIMTIGGLMSFSDLPITKGANLKSGAALFHPGETVVNDVDLAQMARSGGGSSRETQLLKQETQRTNRLMAGVNAKLDQAFGVGGSMFRKGVRVKG